MKIFKKALILVVVVVVASLIIKKLFVSLSYDDAETGNWTLFYNESAVQISSELKFKSYHACSSVRRTIVDSMSESSLLKARDLKIVSNAVCIYKSSDVN